MTESLGTCTMCQQAPATVVWFAPVCQPCAAWLDGLDVDLVMMESVEPDVAEASRAVDEALRREADD